jgi:hypothetical protein
MPCRRGNEKGTPAAIGAPFAGSYSCAVISVSVPGASRRASRRALPALIVVLNLLVTLCRW